MVLVAITNDQVVGMDTTRIMKVSSPIYRVWLHRSYMPVRYTTTEPKKPIAWSEEQWDIDCTPGSGRSAMVTIIDYGPGGVVLSNIQNIPHEWEANPPNSWGEKLVLEGCKVIARLKS